MKTKPTPLTAIITGIGMLGFGLLYFLSQEFSQAGRDSPAGWTP